MLFFRQLTEDDLPSFTELQDADNEIVTTLGPNKELGSVAQLVKNTNTESPVTLSTGAGASIKPILQLKPVPEIVKPAAPTTRRPHTFIRFRKYTLLLFISIYFSLSGGQRLSGRRSSPSQEPYHPSSVLRALFRTAK